MPFSTVIGSSASVLISCNGKPIDEWCIGLFNEELQVWLAVFTTIANA